MDRVWPIISNSEALAVSQSWFGHPGSLHSQDTDTAGRTWQFWSKPQAAGGVAVIGLSRALEFDAAAGRVDLELRVSDFVDTSHGLAHVRDLWAHKDLAPASGLLRFPGVAAHDSVFLLLTPARAAPPATDEDNSGDKDYLFEFAPAALPADQALNIVNSSLPQPFGSATTWGGSVLADPHDPSLFHMWASTFVGPCGLMSWETNSLVSHAVSTSGPGGPYTVRDVAVPSYAHNPEVVWHPSEQLFLLFTLGHPNASAPLACDPSSKRPVGTWGGNGAPPWLSDVSLYTSQSPSGPWEIARNKSTGAPLVVARGLNANPTAWVDARSGQLTLLYGRFDATHRRVYSIKTAKSAAGPWEEQGDLPMAVLAPPRNCSQNSSSPHFRCSCDNEDPFLYRESEEPRRWVLLFHQYERCPSAKQLEDEHGDGKLATAWPPDPSDKVVGGYARSKTGDLLGDWEYDYWKGAYGMQPSEWVPSRVGGDGVPVLTKRERPKLLFDPQTGRPTWLFNGVSNGPDKNENCFTFAQRIVS